MYALSTELDIDWVTAFLVEDYTGKLLKVIAPQKLILALSAYAAVVM